MEQKVIEGLKKEPLGKYKIFVSSAHTFGTDAVILSNFAASSKKSPFLKHCDLGTGCGIIPLLMLKNGTVKSSVGVEIQKEGCILAEYSAKENEINNIFSVINSDLNCLSGKLPFGEFDLVTCNPPYKAAGAGIKNKQDAQTIARHETLCSLEDIVKVSAKLLKFSGRLSICHRPERLADIFVTMRQFKIEPKRLRTVIQKQGEEPWLVLVEGRLGGKSGLKILPPLYVSENGHFTEEMMEIYGDYKEGRGDKI